MDQFMPQLLLSASQTNILFSQDLWALTYVCLQPWSMICTESDGLRCCHFSARQA
jgi:hypothetical protein